MEPTLKTKRGRVAANDDDQVDEATPPKRRPPVKRATAARDTRRTPVSDAAVEVGDRPARRARVRRAPAVRPAEVSDQGEIAGDPYVARPAEVPVGSGETFVHPPAPEARRDAARRFPRGRIPAIAAAAIIVILATAAGYFGMQVSDQNSTNSLRSSALGAANTYGVYLSSYDYRTLTAPTSAWSEVESHATAKFRHDFQSTSAQLASVLQQYKATSQGKVVASGIASLSSTRAVVLLFIDQTVTNSVQKPSTTTQPLRVEVTLARQGGKWLIDNLQVPK